MAWEIHKGQHVKKDVICLFVDRLCSSSQFNHFFCLEPVLRELHRSPLQHHYTSEELFELWNVSVQCCVRVGQVEWVTRRQRVNPALSRSLYDCSANGPAGSSAPLDSFYWLQLVSFIVQFLSEKKKLFVWNKKAASESLEAKWRQKIHQVEVENWKAEEKLK